MICWYVALRFALAALLEVNGGNMRRGDQPDRAYVALQLAGMLLVLTVPAVVAARLLGARRGCAIWLLVMLVPLLYVLAALLVR